MEKVEELKKKQDLNSNSYEISSLSQMIEDCIKLGTIFQSLLDMAL